MPAKAIVHITLDNANAYITDCSDMAETQLRDFWAYYMPGYFHTPAYKEYLLNKQRAKFDGEPDRKVEGWDGKIRLYKRGAVPVGLFRATWKEAEEKLNIKFLARFVYPEIQPFKLGFSTDDPKYKFQDRCADKMCAALHRGGGIVLAATRTGKTRTTAKFFSMVNCSCLFVVDQIDLLYQNQAELQQWLGEEVGIVGDSAFRLQRVTVATVQTLKIHETDPIFNRWFYEVQIVVVDELHEQMSKKNFNLLETIQPIARYGLTATLQLGKKDIRMKAHAFAGPVIFRFPISRGIEEGVLTKGRVVQLMFPENDGWSGGGNTYQDEYREHILQDPSKTTAFCKIVDYLYKQGRYVVVLTERVQHVKDLSNALDVPHRVAYGAVAKDKRVAARKKFETGDVRVIIANKVFKKGITIKRVDTMIDLAEMKSKNDAQQKFGRGIGLHPDKDEMVYIDFGTQGKGRFAKNARSRARTFRSIGIEVKSVKVSSSSEALKVIQRELQAKPEKKQMELF